jgi:threonine dehydratase
VRAFTHKASVGVNFRTGGAAVMAALLSGAYRPRRDERVGVVICGGNTDAVTL